MKLKCSCGMLNDDGSQTCANAECGASLRFAELVEEPAAAPGDAQEPGPASGAAQASGNKCVCNYPDPDPETGICEACDEPVITSHTNASPSASLRPDLTSMLPTSDSALPINARLVLPDGNTLDLAGGVTVGRNAAGTRAALLRFDGVSRSHCWLAQQGDELLVVDLGSKNGTWIGNERLCQHALHRYALATLPIYVRLGRKAQLEVLGERAA